MAKYRAKATLYVDSRLIAPGEQFDSDQTPGKEWEPIDDAARQNAKLKADSDAHVIPNGWRDLSPHARISLAHKLGAPKQGTSAADADKMIEDEIEKREKSNGG